MACVFHISLIRILSQHSAGGVAAHEGEDLFLGDEVEVARDGVLERGSRHGELDYALIVLAVLRQRVQQRGTACIAHAHCVYHVVHIVDS